ncbi:site-specific integrase [Bacteroides sp. 224]|uniref:site-specific integrase n=1 Tax=Bacteroides sp. 224 TaxID=2302936 RepID=UPI0013D007C8|nr:site-specific integrase [Bacteroides sp. 224]NDV66756.1 hypothetical protein [Bacteroides sp. 224]
MNLSNFVMPLIFGLRNEGRRGTAKAYRSTLNSVLEYGGKDLKLSTVFEKSWLSNYQLWISGRGLESNTSSFYLSILQRLYHQALEIGLVKHIPDLFANILIRHTPTQKRALPAAIISLISEADLSGKKGLEFSRDMFMLSFYLQGIAFVDLAFLRKADWKGGSIRYYRRKSKSYINTPVSEEAKRILLKYRALTSKESPYLLPIITEKEREAYDQYQSALRNQNRRLKRIATFLGITENLTTYVSRHSWATIAHHEGVPASHISQALGHQTEVVTHVYLKSFDDSVLRNANSIVIAAVNRGMKVNNNKPKWIDRKGVGTGRVNRNENVRHCISDGHFRDANIEV